MHVIQQADVATDNRHIKNILCIGNTKTQYFFLIILAMVAGITEYPYIIKFANVIADFFIAVLKWSSIPIVALSILSTTSKLKNSYELLSLGGNTLKYTVITTIISAGVGLGTFLIIQPVNYNLNNISLTNADFLLHHHNDLFGWLLLGTVFFAVICSFFILLCRLEVKENISLLLTKQYQWLIFFIQAIFKLMPITIWAFITIFVKEINSLNFKILIGYLSCVLLANIIQAAIVLPLFLRYKQLAVRPLFNAVLPILNAAFWLKSSSAVLPLAINCVIEKSKIPEKIAKFTLPLCTTINRNACSAFIIITVLFVTTSYGETYTILQLLSWIGIATLAAISNAGVPMGCFTMVIVLLTYLHVPLHIMTLILPFYLLLDMLESAINVWSDICVTAIIAKDLDGI
jgi:Na+/H+-dicarboxylate symporter